MDFRDLYDFGKEFAQTYRSKCVKCGRVIEVSAQRYNEPEYRTVIYVKCQCGGSVEFVLPVN